MPRVSWAPCRPSGMTVRCAPNPSTTRSARCRRPRRWPPPRRRSRRLSRRLDRLLSCGAGWNPAADPEGTPPTRPERRYTTGAQLAKLPHKAWVSAVLHSSRRRQGAIDTLDGGVLRIPEALRFHLLQVGVGIAEATPDVFLVGEQP